MQCRALRRRDHADGARPGGQRALARGVEPARRLELRLQLREALVERARAGRPHPVDDELELAARLVQRRRRAHVDRHAVGQLEVEQLRLAAPQHAAHLRALVLEREVAVARRRAQEAGDLAADPHRRKRALDRLSRHRDELGHRDRRRSGDRRFHAHRAASPVRCTLERLVVMDKSSTIAARARHDRRPTRRARRARRLRGSGSQPIDGSGGFCGENLRSAKKVPSRRGLATPNVQDMHTRIHRNCGQAARAPRCPAGPEGAPDADSRRMGRPSREAGRTSPPAAG